MNQWPTRVRTGVPPSAAFVTLKVFEQALKALAVEEREPTILEPERKLSACPPFPWSRQTYEAKKTVFNLVPIDSALEGALVEFLDQADDVVGLDPVRGTSARFTGSLQD